MPRLLPTEPVTCERCGFGYEQQVRSDKRHKGRCPECTKAKLPRPNVQYELAVEVTRYRMAIELATYALRRGKPAVALDLLEQVPAPARP